MIKLTASMLKKLFKIILFEIIETLIASNYLIYIDDK